MALAYEFIWGNYVHVSEERPPEWDILILLERHFLSHTNQRMELLYQTAPGEDKHEITWEWFIVENDNILY